MLAEHLSRIALDFERERMKPFAGSAFGDYVRNDVSQEAKKQISLWHFALNVKSSVGQGVWAAVPWLAFFDPLVTETATRGYYVVFLINPISHKIHLSLNQGTTEIYREYGPVRGREILSRRARDISDRVPEFVSRFSTSPIDLGSDAPLPAGYMAGHAFGKSYNATKISQSELVQDLFQILSAYEALTARGGTTPPDVMQEESGTTDIEETRRYFLSRRIERATKVRSKVLSSRSLKCECCGLDPKRDYGYTGADENTPLDVHHAAPLRGLAEGETRRYTIPDDFLVLCPTCHRMIHKQDDPSDLRLLKSRLRFKIARETTFPIFE